MTNNINRFDLELYINGQGLRWSFELHRLVNDSLHKTSPSWTEVEKYFGTKNEMRENTPDETYKPQSVVLEFVFHTFFTFGANNATVRDMYEFLVAAKSLMLPSNATVIESAMNAVPFGSCTFTWSYSVYKTVYSKLGLAVHPPETLQAFFVPTPCPVS